jgi:hypothetical protein
MSDAHHSTHHIVELVITYTLNPIASSIQRPTSNTRRTGIVGAAHTPQPIVAKSTGSADVASTPMPTYTITFVSTARRQPATPHGGG